MANELQVSVIEDIGGWGYNAQSLIRELQGFNGDVINVPINSYGGSVTDGLAIYNILKGVKQTVNTNIIGYAMSMGTIVALAGDNVSMPKNAYFMIHNPWSMAVGDHEEMKQSSELLKSMANQLASMYSDASRKRNGKDYTTKSEFLKLMAAETWMTANQAKKHGLIDNVTDGALFDISNFPEMEFMAKLRNIPEGVLDNSNKNDMGLFGDIFGKKEKEAGIEDKAVEPKPNVEASSDFVTKDDLRSFMSDYTSNLVKEIKSDVVQPLVGKVKELKSTNEELVKSNNNMVAELKDAKSEISTIKENATKLASEVVPSGVKVINVATEVTTEVKKEKAEGGKLSGFAFFVTLKNKGLTKSHIKKHK